MKFDKSLFKPPRKSYVKSLRRHFAKKPSGIYTLPAVKIILSSFKDSSFIRHWRAAFSRKKNSFAAAVRFFNMIWFIHLDPARNQGQKPIVLKNPTPVAKLLFLNATINCRYTLDAWHAAHLSATIQRAILNGSIDLDQPHLSIR